MGWSKISSIRSGSFSSKRTNVHTNILSILTQMIRKISNMFFVHWLGIKQQLKCPKTLLFSWPSGETKKNLIFLFLLLFCAKKHDTLGCGNSGKESLAHPINIYEDGVYIRLRCHLCLIASPEMGIWHLRCVKLLNPPISAEQNGSLLLTALQYIL